MAPSNELRKVYHSGAISWEEFEKNYLLELEKHQDQLKEFLYRYRRDPVTLLYSSKNEEKNNASILKQYLMKLSSKFV